MKTIRWLLALAAMQLQLFAADPIETIGVIDAPVRDVWNAWATTGGLQSWLAPKADIDLRVDGRMRTQYNPAGTLGGPGTIENRILCFEPERLLAIRVAKAPDDFPFKETVGEMWTVLYFTPLGDGQTQLRIVGLGFGEGEASQKIRNFFVRGNAFTVEQLKQHFRPASKPDSAGRG